MTFKLGMDSDMAQVLVQNRVSLALPVIPALVQNEGINVKKVSPSTMMIVNLVSPDGRYDATFLSNYATIYIRDELGRLPGVADITYFGQRDYSLRAWLDPDKLAALGLTAADVVTAIAQQNLQVAAGQIGQEPVPKGQQFQLTINTLGRLTDPEQFADIIVKAGSGHGIGGKQRPEPAAAGDLDRQHGHAADAAGQCDDQRPRRCPRRPASSGSATWRRVVLGSQQYEQSCTLDGKPSVALSIYQLPGSNALETAEQVYDKMEELKSRFPDGVEYQIVYDTTPFIRESVNEVFYTLRDAIILVALVVLAFLQNWRAALIPLIAVPVAIVGTFAVMAALGFSLNNLSLFGLVLAIGIVVDDAIVVVENIERWLEQGIDAARGGAQGHGRSHRAGHRRGPGALRGLRAGRLPGRDHGPVLPPIRRDDRRFHGDLGLQLADAQPGPGRHPAAAARRRHARSADLALGPALGLVLPLVQPRLRRRHGPVRPRGGRPVARQPARRCWSTAACWC